jgi:hypothetical protein
MNEDKVRVIRILSYEGPRSAVEAQIERSVSGTRIWGRLGAEVKITAVTLGTFPEILERAAEILAPADPCIQCEHPLSVHDDYGCMVYHAGKYCPCAKQAPGGFDGVLRDALSTGALPEVKRVETPSQEENS